MIWRILLTALLMAALISGWSDPSSEAHGPSISIDIGEPPELVLVPGTSVYYAPSVPLTYFLYGQQYYLFTQGTWFAATTYDGPWIIVSKQDVPKPILAVPVAYYKVPPGHAKKHGAPSWAGHGREPKAKKPKHH
jgi:hypothetical protein